MSVFRGRFSLNETIRDFMHDYRYFQRSGLNGSIDVYVSGTQVCSIPKQLLDNLGALSIESNYWQHKGIKYKGNIVIPLWNYSGSVTPSGFWNFQNSGGIRIAEVNQTVNYNDPIVAELLFTFPELWIKNIDFSNDLTASLVEITGYATFYTEDQSEIESVLLALASVGLHAFEKLGNWCHSLEVGCHLLEITPGLVEVNCTPRFNLERARMFRFACSAHDPFDAIIRYWHIVEHMYDDLIYDSISSLLAVTPRQLKFGKSIQDIASETKCAREIFIRNIDDVSFNSLIQFVNRNGLQTHITNAVTILGGQIGQMAFWNKNAYNGKEALGALLYSCRNAIAHRRESESWFNRLDITHYQSVKEIIPIFHYSIHTMLQDM